MCRGGMCFSLSVFSGADSFLSFHIYRVKDLKRAILLNLDVKLMVLICETH